MPLANVKDDLIMKNLIPFGLQLFTGPSWTGLRRLVAVKHPLMMLPFERHPLVIVMLAGLDHS